MKGRTMTAKPRTSEGFVYVITNPAWPGWVKVGKTDQMRRRVSQYQTSSPFRDFKVQYSRAVEDRHAAESGAHDRLRKLADEYDGEWFKVAVKTAVFVVNQLQ